MKKLFSLILLFFLFAMVKSYAACSDYSGKGKIEGSPLQVVKTSGEQTFTFVFTNNTNLSINNGLLEMSVDSSYFSDFIKVTVTAINGTISSITKSQRGAYKLDIGISSLTRYTGKIKIIYTTNKALLPNNNVKIFSSGNYIYFNSQFCGTNSPMLVNDTNEIYLYMPTATATITNTKTNTPTPTATKTKTNTATATNTYTKTNTPTITNTATITNTPTITKTPTVTATPTPYSAEDKAALYQKIVPYDLDKLIKGETVYATYRIEKDAGYRTIGLFCEKKDTLVAISIIADQTTDIYLYEGTEITGIYNPNIFPYYCNYLKYGLTNMDNIYPRICDYQGNTYTGHLIATSKIVNFGGVYLMPNKYIIMTKDVKYTLALYSSAAATVIVRFEVIK